MYITSIKYISPVVMYIRQGKRNWEIQRTQNNNDEINQNE